MPVEPAVRILAPIDHGPRRALAAAEPVEGAYLDEGVAEGDQRAVTEEPGGNGVVSLAALDRVVDRCRPVRRAETTRRSIVFVLKSEEEVRCVQ